MMNYELKLAQVKSARKIKQSSWLNPQPWTFTSDD
jgi:hypothetical protein